MNAAIWCRVSTDDQSNLNQLGALRSWAERRGLTVVNEYRVEESAWTGKHRAALAAAVEDARLGQYEVLLVWALDRLSREGIEATLSTMRHFRERGVRVLSLQEAWTDGPEAMQELLGAFFAWMAQQEISPVEASASELGWRVGRRPGYRLVVYLGQRTRCLGAELATTPVTKLTALETPRLAQRPNSTDVDHWSEGWQRRGEMLLTVGFGSGILWAATIR